MKRCKVSANAGVEMLLGAVVNYKVIAFTRGGPPADTALLSTFTSGGHTAAAVPKAAPGAKASRRARRKVQSSTSIGTSLRIKGRTGFYFNRVLPAKEGQSSLPHGQLSARSMQLKDKFY